MSLPRFISRVADAAIPLLGGLDRGDFTEHLAGTAVGLAVAEEVAAANHHLSHAFLLAVNLAARFYPRLVIDAPPELRSKAEALAFAINPLCETESTALPVSSQLVFTPDSPTGNEVTVWASGWNVVIDGGAGGPLSTPLLPAALAAGTLGMAEVFRAVFADLLGPVRGRTAPQPGSLSLITTETWTQGLDIELKRLNVGRVHLVGAGAIGQAAVEVFRHLDLTGSLVVVDHEAVDLSNLQRYVLTRDEDEHRSKTAIVKQALADSSSLEVHEVPQRWGLDLEAQGNLDAVLVALDTAEDRMGVQASLPRRIYNAYTQPLDLGWSRHEAFGVEPCLACLYWPTSRTPSRHEVIAQALGESPWRVLAYLASRRPVGTSLVATELVPPVEATAVERGHWTTVPLLEDLIGRFGLPADARPEWANSTIEDLYRRGVCGGAIIKTGTGSSEREVVVPLAHQSAFAGIMLAVQLLASSHPVLAHARPDQVEGRFDVLGGLPQVPGVPRARTPGCICSDADFFERWEEFQQMELL